MGNADRNRVAAIEELQIMLPFQREFFGAAPPLDSFYVASEAVPASAG